MDIATDFLSDIHDLLSHYTNRLLQPINSLIHTVITRITGYTWFTIKLWLLCIIGVITIISTLCISILLYVIIYNVMIPVHHITVPVQFDYTAHQFYTPPPSHNHIPHNSITQQSSTDHALSTQQPSSTLHIQPTASVSLTEQQWKYTVNATYIADHPAQELYIYSTEYNADNYRLLYGGQSYNIELLLTVPYNTINQQIGMTSVTSDIYHLDYKLATAIQSFLPLPCTNSWIQSIWRVIISPLLIAGLYTEQYQHKLLLFDNYYEHSTSYSTHIQLILSSLHAHTLQLYQAQLQFTVQLNGIRYLMYYWKYTVAAFTVLTLTATQCICIFVSMLILYIKLILNNDKSNNDYIPEFNDHKYNRQYRRRPRDNNNAANDMRSDTYNTTNNNGNSSSRPNPSMPFKYNSVFDTNTETPINTSSTQQSQPPSYSQVHTHRSASPVIDLSIDDDATRPIKAQPAPFHYSQPVNFDDYINTSSDDDINSMASSEHSDSSINDSKLHFNNNKKNE